MQVSSANLRQNSIGESNILSNFPVSASLDYAAVKNISKCEVENWSFIHLQLFMDYCLSKEIFEVAAMIKDAANAKGLILRNA